MMLAVDIGNTSVSIGVMRGKVVQKVLSVDSTLNKKMFTNKLNKIITQIANKKNIKSIVICSVVPQKTQWVYSIFKKYYGIKPRVIGKDLIVPIKNKYRNPKQVGPDRLVGAYAAKILYGSPAIIIDFGTAITFDVVSKTGAYEGGMIIPGIQLSVNSLFENTAMLPRVEHISIPKNFVGKDTQESILSGVFYGYGTMCQGIIDLISKKIKGRPKVIVTGGYTKSMRRFISQKIHKIDKHLVFKGLYHLSSDVT